MYALSSAGVVRGSYHNPGVEPAVMYLLMTYAA